MTPAAPTAMRRRVVQWTTGNTGRAAVLGILDHPSLELVGCFAFSPTKVGRDVGELCGIEPIGITATDDIDALLALEPDCVAYLPSRPDLDHLERILRAGVNVVTTMFMLAGHGYGEPFTHRLHEAAAAGHASLYATGVYPGHVPTVALATTAMCRRIDRVTVLESLDIAGYANEQMFRAMGYDLDPDDAAATRACEAACGSFKDQVALLAHALGVELDDIRFTVDVATADRTADLGFMTIHRGKIAGFRGTVAGIVDDRSAIECRFVWKLGDAMTPDWPVTRGYLVEIHGDPGVRLELGPLDGHLDGATTTAMPAVNAIPAVCAAPPGIVNRGALPLIAGTAGRRTTTPIASTTASA